MAAKKRSILGAAGAAGVVAAATAVGVAAVRRRSREPVTWHIRPGDDGWVVSRDGADEADSTHGTKKEAISAGRERAGGDPPSTLVLHYADGREQKRITYDG